MGMFDMFQFVDAEAPRCAHDHPLPSLQTKSLRCLLLDYYILGGQLFCPPGRFPDPGLLPETREVVGEVLRLTEVRIARPSRLTGTVTAGTFCFTCKPVLVLRGPPSSADAIDEHRPSCDFDLTFTDGRLGAIVPTERETREELETTLRGCGAHVVDDDDPRAVAHRRRRDAPVPPFDDDLFVTHPE